MVPFSFVTFRILRDKSSDAEPLNPLHLIDRLLKRSNINICVLSVMIVRG